MEHGIAMRIGAGNAVAVALRGRRSLDKMQNSQFTALLLQAAKRRLLCRGAGCSLRDRVRSSATQRGCK